MRIEINGDEKKIFYPSHSLKWIPRAKSSKLVVHRCKRTEYYIKWNCVVLTQAKKRGAHYSCAAEFSAFYYLSLASPAVRSWYHICKAESIDQLMIFIAFQFHLMANTLAPLWSCGVWSLHTHTNAPASSVSVRFDAFHTLQITGEIHFFSTKKCYLHFDHIFPSIGDAYGFKVV